MTTTIDIPDGSSSCVCGLVHRVDIEEISIGEGATASLVDYARRKAWTKAALVMDPNTAEAAGDSVAEALRSAGIDPRPVLLRQRHGLLADEEAVALVTEALGNLPDAAMVAVGSGTITDVVRYVAHDQGRRMVSVATAASMDGYASGMAAMQFGGVKISFETQPPVAIFADPAVAAAAPAEMSVWGLGDLLGKVTAGMDWLAGHYLYGEQFCPVIAERALSALRGLLDDVDGLLTGGIDETSMLLSGLIQSGIAMAMMGNSRPASGSEHHASHFWDLLAYRGTRRHTPHGLQVGYATGFMLDLQRFAFGGGLDHLDRAQLQIPIRSDPEAMELYRSNLAAVEKAEEDKNGFLDAGYGIFRVAGHDWKDIRRAIKSEIDSFSRIDSALEKAGIPRRPGFIEIDESILRLTFRQANRLRARYTVLDLLQGQGALEAAVDAVLADH